MTFNTRAPRAYTNALFDAVEAGEFDKDTLIRDLLNYLSEADVKEFVETNDYEEIIGAPTAEDDPEEEWTPDNADFNDKGSRHHY